MADKTQLPGWYRQGREYFLKALSCGGGATDVDQYGFWKIPAGDTETATKTLPTIPDGQTGTPLYFRLWAWDDAYAGAPALNDLDLTWADIATEAFPVDWDGGSGADSASLTFNWDDTNKRFRSDSVAFSNTSGVEKTIKGILITAHMNTASGPTHTEAQIRAATYGQYRGFVVGFVQYDTPATVANGEGWSVRVSIDVGGIADSIVRSGNITLNSLDNGIGGEYRALVYFIQRNGNSFSSHTLRYWVYQLLSGISGDAATGTNAISPAYSAKTDIVYSEAGGVPMLTFAGATITNNTGSPITAVGIAIRFYDSGGGSMEGPMIVCKLATPVVVNNTGQYVVNQVTFSMEQTALT